MPATDAASRRASTPRRLRRLLALMLGAAAVLWITATGPGQLEVILRGLDQVRKAAY